MFLKNVSPKILFRHLQSTNLFLYLTIFKQLNPSIENPKILASLHHAVFMGNAVIITALLSALACPTILVERQTVDQSALPTPNAQPISHVSKKSVKTHVLARVALMLYVKSLSIPLFAPVLWATREILSVVALLSQVRLFCIYYIAELQKTIEIFISI